MTENFDNTIQKTNELLKEIEMSFGWVNRRNQSVAALRAVLHILRDRLTIEETAQLGAGLPLLVRGLFYEGWKPKKVPKKMDKEEFLQEIRKQFPFSIEGNTEDLVKIVLNALGKYIPPGEMEDIISVMPKDIAKILSNC